MRGQWTTGGVEPSLEEMLDDPIVRLLMHRDGLTRQEIMTVMTAARRGLHKRRR